MSAKNSPIQLEAKGAIRAASTMMQAFYGQRIEVLKQLESNQDKRMLEKLANIWERIALMCDSQLEAIVLFASLLTEELDSKITIVVA